MSQEKLEILIAAKDKATAALNKVRNSLSQIGEKAANVSAGALNTLTSSLANLGSIAATAGVTGVAALATGVAALAVQGVKAYASMQQMRAALETAFGGNIELAKEAEKQITQFASKTPFDVGEVMTAFIKLKNMGLNPSEKALKAYGDTASSMGKSLNDMVEAVADAATGEFERLKEFGIRASSQGDKVSFTFKGVTQTVGKNSKEIEDYLVRLGEVNFAGGMERQSKTLSGMWSTFVDTVNIKLADFIEKSKIGDILTEGLGKAISWIESVDLIGMLNNVTGAFGDLFDIIQTGDVISGNGLLNFFTSDQITVITDAINNVKPYFEELFNMFKQMQPIVEAVMKAVTDAVAIAMPLIQQYFTEVVPILEAAVKRITDEILPLIIPIVNQVVEVFRLIQPYLQPVISWLVATIGNAINTAITIFKGLLQFVGGFLDVLIGLFSGNGDKVRQGFIGMFNGLATIVGGIFKGIGNAIINNINFASDQINRVLEKTGTGMKIPRLSNLAAGGKINSSLIRVGENGPEIINTRTMSVMNKSNTARLDSANKSATQRDINISISLAGMPPVLDTKAANEFVRNIKDVLIRQLKTELT